MDSQMPKRPASSPESAAGWFADPTSVVADRYFDGSSWTALTRPRGTVNPANASESTDDAAPNFASSASIWLAIAQAVLWLLAWLLGVGLVLLSGMFGVGALVLGIIGTARSRRLGRGKVQGVTAIVLSALCLLLTPLPFAASPQTVGSPSAGVQSGVVPAGSYPALGDRELALIAKDPNSHIGAGATVYGSVSQFDTATGPCAFLALAGATPEQVQWGPYRESMYFITSAESCSLLADIVQGDSFSARVTATGSVSYDSLAGTSVTVAAFQIESIELIPLPNY